MKRVPRKMTEAKFMMMKQRHKALRCARRHTVCECVHNGDKVLTLMDHSIVNRNTLCCHEKTIVLYMIVGADRKIVDDSFEIEIIRADCLITNLIQTLLNHFSKRSTPQKTVQTEFVFNFRYKRINSSLFKR